MLVVVYKVISTLFPCSNVYARVLSRSRRAMEADGAVERLWCEGGDGLAVGTWCLIEG
jgi:hypothetical protein